MLIFGSSKYLAFWSDKYKKTRCNYYYLSANILVKNILLMPILFKVGESNIEDTIEYIIQQSRHKSYEDFTPKKISSKKFETIKISNDYLSIKLIDKQQLDLLAVVNGKISSYHNIKYFEITGTYSKNKRQGLVTYIFEILVYELGYKILSDSQHSSPGSKEFWQSHIRKRKFSIYRLDIRTNYKRRAKRYKEDEIWAKKDLTVTYLNNYGDYIKNRELDIYDDSGDSFDRDYNLEEVDELLDLETRGDSLKMENIRLVAEKYVSPRKRTSPRKKTRILASSKKKPK